MIKIHLGISVIASFTNTWEFAIHLSWLVLHVSVVDPVYDLWHYPLIMYHWDTSSCLMPHPRLPVLYPNEKVSLNLADLLSSMLFDRENVYTRMHSVPTRTVRSSSHVYPSMHWAGAVYPRMHWAGCVYPRMHWAGGVCRGVCPGCVCVSQHALGQTPPYE